MPYKDTKSLPSNVRKKFRGEKRRRQFAHVFNAVLAKHGDEGRAFAGAWSATKRAHAKKKRKAQRRVESVHEASFRTRRAIAEFMGESQNESVPMLRSACDRLSEHLSRTTQRAVDLWETTRGNTDLIVKAVRSLPIDKEEKASIVGHVLLHGVR